MFFIKADICLTDVNRKNPLQGTTCRPMLYLPNNIIRTGLLFIGGDEVLDMTKCYDDRLLGIYAYKDINPFSVFAVGTNFQLAEGSILIGNGVITKCIGENTVV